MPRILDPGTRTLEAFLHSAHTKARRANAELYKTGTVDKKLWQAIESDIKEARKYLNEKL